MFFVLSLYTLTSETLVYTCIRCVDCMFTAAGNSTTINYKQFCAALKGFLIPHTDKAARDLFKELDVDGNGTCDYSEFLKGVMRTDRRVKLSLDRTQDYRNDVGMLVSAGPSLYALLRSSLPPYLRSSISY